MKLRKYVYLYLALWFVFPGIVIAVSMADLYLLIGTTGTAFFIQIILNRIAAVCGIVLAFLDYRETKKALADKVILAILAAGVVFLLLCWNFLCSFFDDSEEYHSFTSPDGAHTVVIMERADGISGQVTLYERVNPFLISPKERIITNNGYRPVCAGKYSLVWDGDTVTLSVSDGAGGNGTISVALGQHGG